MKRLGLTGQEKVGTVMREFYHHKLRSGSGHKVTDVQQAKAIAMSEGRRAQKEAMRHHSPEVDEHAATELFDFCFNESSTYAERKAITTNLAKKMAKGVYDPHKAAKLWMYWVERNAELYAKEFAPGSKAKVLFDAPTRRHVAHEVEEHTRHEVKSLSETLGAQRHHTLSAGPQPSAGPKGKPMATRKHHKKHRTHKVDSRSLHGAKSSHTVGRRPTAGRRPPSAKQLAARKKFAEAARKRSHGAKAHTKTHTKRHHAKRRAAHSRPQDRMRTDVRHAERDVKRAEHQLVRSHADKGRALKHDIQCAVHDLAQAERELHEAQKLIRAHKASVLGSGKKGHKKHHKKAHHKAPARISTARAIALARKGT